MKKNFFFRMLVILLVGYAVLTALIIILLKERLIDGFQAFALEVIVGIVVYFGGKALVTLLFKDN